MANTTLPQTLVAACGLVLCFSTDAKEADETTAARVQSITEFDGQDGMNWQVVNDGVMGGLSEGKLTPNKAGTLRFSGMLSLENNGGFSTFRSGDVKLDLSNALGLLLRVKGDGRTYQVRLATDALFRGMEVSFAAEFATQRGEWIEVKVPFAGFKGSFRGLDLPEERLDTSKVRRVSILLGDKKQAPFEAEFDFIRTYGATASKG
jgi:monofunctional biosynthetic peptidoglycan transglycosylase